MRAQKGPSVTEGMRGMQPPVCQLPPSVSHLLRVTLWQLWQLRHFRLQPGSKLLPAHSGLHDAKCEGHMVPHARLLKLTGSEGHCPAEKTWACGMPRANAGGPQHWPYGCSPAWSREVQYSSCHRELPLALLTLLNSSLLWRGRWDDISSGVRT